MLRFEQDLGHKVNQKNSEGYFVLMESREKGYDLEELECIEVRCLGDTEYMNAIDYEQITLIYSKFIFVDLCLIKFWNLFEITFRTSTQ